VVDPTTFEFECARISAGQFSAIFVVVHRPRSSTIQPDSFRRTVVITRHRGVPAGSDFNIHLERSDDPATKQFLDLLCHYGFSLRPTAATHGASGTLDAVIACDATDSGHCVDSQLNVSVVDAGLSDHNFALVESHGLYPHFYAKDMMQIYGSCPPSGGTSSPTTSVCMHR